DHLLECPFHREGHAIGRPHIDTDGAAGAHIQLAHRIRKATRTPPLRHVTRISPGFEYQGTWRLEHAGKDELPPGFSLLRHGRSPSPEVRADTHRAGRAGRPSAGGIGRSMSPPPPAGGRRAGKGAIRPAGSM